MPANESESEYIERCIKASDVVQQEDVFLCESVQAGLESSAYHTGRYAPNVSGTLKMFVGVLSC